MICTILVHVWQIYVPLVRFDGVTHDNCPVRLAVTISTSDKDAQIFMCRHRVTQIFEPDRLKHSFYATTISKDIRITGDPDTAVFTTYTVEIITDLKKSASFVVDNVVGPIEKDAHNFFCDPIVGKHLLLGEKVVPALHDLFEFCLNACHPSRIHVFIELLKREHLF